MYLTRTQVRKIDHICIENYRIPGIVLMENASRAVAEVALQMLAQCNGKRALILAGSGNNGGDGIAAARHLHNHGIAVSILYEKGTTPPPNDAVTQMSIAQHMKLKSRPATPAAIARANCDLIIDGLFGTGLKSAPREPSAKLIQAVNATGKPVLAIDIPSGLDCDTGLPLGPCIKAARTVTLVALKVGFSNPASKEWTGDVTVGDIGCPRELIVRMSKSPH